jgi:hypothetical protein
MMRSFLLSGLLIILFLMNNPAYAQLSLSSPTNLNFGAIEFSAGGGQNDVFLGTNGSVTYSNNFTGNGSGTPGELLIIDSIGTTVEIACNKDLTIADGASTVAVDQIEYVIGLANGVGTGVGQACRGVSKFDQTHVVTGNAAQDTLLIGGRIRAAVSSVFDGTWSSLNTGGVGVTFMVLVQ